MNQGIPLIGAYIGEYLKLTVFFICFLDWGSHIRTVDELSHFKSAQLDLVGFNQLIKSSSSWLL